VIIDRRNCHNRGGKSRISQANASQSRVSSRDKLTGPGLGREA
jgi:hypothetical protein